MIGIKLFANTVHGSIEGVLRAEILEAFKHLKIGMAPGPSESYAEIIPASGYVGIRVLMESCQRILDGKVMPAFWATCVAIPIFKGKGDIINFCMYRGVEKNESC